MLLIPTMDSDSQTKIIDQDSNRIVVRSNYARRQRHLTIHEFHIAFSDFKNVVSEKEPERRKELDAYSDLIDSMFGQFGGSHFYEYHKSFVRKAEQYFLTMGVSVDWLCRDSALYMQTLTGLRHLFVTYVQVYLKCKSMLHLRFFFSASQFNSI